MRNLFIFAMLSVFGAGLCADPAVDTAAPNFTGVDMAGKKHSLKDFHRSWVVLEWYNKDCPYVKKHYDSQNMQKLQKSFTEKGVKWLSIISSAKDKQGYLTAKEATENYKASGSAATTVILDSDGSIGKTYGAKTTPHLFVIDPRGTLIYAGAIDDNDSSNPKVIPQSKNYVELALNSAMQNKPVATKTSKPYGCSIKY